MGGAPSAGGTSEARKLTLLMVDDHVDTVRAMKRLLERQGYAVRTADSVATALAVAAEPEARFDALVSDIGLPDGTGVELLNKLRDAGHDVPAVALSGFGMDDDVQRSREAGFRDHLTKPVNFARLQEIIQNLIGDTVR